MPFSFENTVTGNDTGSDICPLTFFRERGWSVDESRRTAGFVFHPPWQWLVVSIQRKGARELVKIDQVRRAALADSHLRKRWRSLSVAAPPEEQESYGRGDPTCSFSSLLRSLFLNPQKSSSALIKRLSKIAQ